MDLKLKSYNPIYPYLINLMVFNSWQKFSLKLNHKIFEIKNEISSSDSDSENSPKNNFNEIFTLNLESNGDCSNNLENNLEMINNHKTIQNCSKNLYFNGKIIKDL